MLCVMALTHDDLIKNLLLQPRLLKDFLDAFLPEVFEFADFEVLEYMDKEHPRSGRKPRRRGDLLLKVRWKDQVGMFLIHIESQGQAQDVIVQRAAEYCLRDSIQYRLPVMPVVLLTYAKPATEVSQRLDWRFGKLAAIQVQCPILHFWRIDPMPHLSGKNLAALALANVMDLTSDQRVEVIVQTLAESIRQGLSPSEEEAVVEFATSVSELSETQLLQINQKVTTLAKKEKRLARMPKLINPFVEIGKITGRQEGRAEGELVILLRQLAKKFPKLAPKVEKQVRTFDEETLLSFGEALLFMQTPKDCEKWLKARR
jgi:hypothetical protein